METIKTDICVIGAGSAGLSVAAGAVQMGARTTLVEADRMGGDCLNTGCVPSKSLLAAAKAAHQARGTAKYGIHSSDPRIDFPAVTAYVRGVIDRIAPHDSVERFRGLGCTVLQARAKFLDARTLSAGEVWIQARRFVIATGSRPKIPPIPGLAETPHFTNETLFANDLLPAHLIIIGAGAIGCEMAQAHRRLGARVTVLDSGPLLPKDDPEAAAIVRRVLQDEGIAVLEGVTINSIEPCPVGVTVLVSEKGVERRLVGSHLLVAAGRQPNVEDLGLDRAKVDHDAGGITVDRRLRTSNPRIYAAGDVAGGPQFTHVAGYHAGIILRNALFRLPAKTDLTALPWVTFTDPELAQVGHTELQARRLYGPEIRVLTAPFAENDRTLTEGESVGFAKVIATPRGRVLGATIVGRQAGELIQPWGLAIAQGLKLGALAGLIVSYPTLGEINKRVAGSFYTPTLFGARMRFVVRLLGMLG